MTHPIPHKLLNSQNLREGDVLTTGVETSVILFEDKQVVPAFLTVKLNVRCNIRSLEFEGTNANVPYAMSGSDDIKDI